jgi:hypothetical protein
VHEHTNKPVLILTRCPAALSLRSSRRAPQCPATSRARSRIGHTR